MSTTTYMFYFYFIYPAMPGIPASNIYSGIHHRPETHHGTHFPVSWVDQHQTLLAEEGSGTLFAHVFALQGRGFWCSCFATLSENMGCWSWTWTWRIISRCIEAQRLSLCPRKLVAIQLERLSRICCSCAERYFIGLSRWYCVLGGCLTMKLLMISKFSGAGLVISKGCYWS